MIHYCCAVTVQCNKLRQKTQHAVIAAVALLMSAIVSLLKRLLLFCTTHQLSAARSNTAALIALPHLTAICIWPRVCHAQHASACVPKLLVNFILKLATIYRLPTPACACGVTTLDDKVADDTVELQGTGVHNISQWPCKKTNFSCCCRHEILRESEPMQCANPCLL